MLKTHPKSFSFEFKLITLVLLFQLNTENELLQEQLYEANENQETLQEQV